MKDQIIADMKEAESNRKASFQHCATLFSLVTHEVYSFARYFSVDGDRVKLVETNLDGCISNTLTKSFDYSGLINILTKYKEFSDRVESSLQTRLRFTDQSLTDYLHCLHFFEYDLANAYTDGQIELCKSLNDPVTATLYHSLLYVLSENTIKDIINSVGDSRVFNLTQYHMQHNLKLPVKLFVEEDGSITFIFVGGSMSICYENHKPSVILRSHTVLKGKDIISWVSLFAEDVYLLIYCLLKHFKSLEFSRV